MTSDLGNDASDGMVEDASRDVASSEAGPSRGVEATRPSLWTVRVLLDGVEHRFAGVDRVAIGASASCHVVVDDVPARPIHCEILLDGGWWLCARSPVRLAGQEVHGWVPVSSADRFEIGSHTFVVLFEEEQKDRSTGAAEALNVRAPDDSESVAPPPAPAAVDGRRRRWPPTRRSIMIASAAAVAIIAMVSALLLVDGHGDGANTAARRRQVVAKPDGSAASAERRDGNEPKPVEPPAAVAMPRERPVDRPAPLQVTHAARQAAHALLGGDYRTALQHYRVVAAAGDATAARFVRALEQRVAARCRRTGRPPEECLR